MLGRKIFVLAEQKDLLYHMDAYASQELIGYGSRSRLAHGLSGAHLNIGIP